MNTAIRFRLIALAVMLFVSLLPLRSSYATYQEFLNEFNSWQLDPSKVIEVSDLFLSRDVANIEIQSGKFYYCKPLAGRVCAFLFKGKGTFGFTPPNKVEQGQLQRFFKVNEFNSEITSAFFIYGDTTALSFLNDFKPKTEEAPAEVSKLLETGKYYLLDKEKENVDDYVARTFLNGKQNEMFFALFTLADGKEVIFYIDPYDEEEVNFLRTDWYAVVGKYSENVCKFGMQGHKKESDTLDKDDIDIEKETIICDFDSKLDLTCLARLSLRVLQENIQWVPFYLYQELQVGTVRHSNGTVLPFYKSEKYPYIWVKFPTNLQIGDTLEIGITYRGKIIRYYGDYTALKSSIGWYPNHGYKTKSVFDLTFKYPKNNKLASVGKLLSEEETEDQKISHWLTLYRIRNASFNIGYFDSKLYEEKECIPVELFYKTRKMKDAVKEDVCLSLEFYMKLIGKIRPEKLNVTELPEGRGEAFPGMLDLSTATFFSTSKEGFNEQFCSHEVAHQWWGIEVDFKSYRDQWLSEAFAEYSSMMYTQSVLKDNDKFFRFLKDYKEEIIGVRKSLFGKGIEPGPISLGGRNRSSLTPDDYSLIIYKKGAWVLHMLRNMLIDLRTMKEDKFFGLLKGFYEKYKGKSASTEDFIKYTSAVSGEDMSWFFDQWVDSYKIPTYQFAYKTEKTPEGKYKIHCRVKQSDVPPDFRMVIPFKIVFDNDKFARVRAKVTGETAEFDLPLMPLEPKEVIFNDLESVLCEYDYESWD